MKDDSYSVKTKLVKKKEIQIDYFLFVHRKVPIRGVDVMIEMSQTEIFFAKSGLKKKIFLS